MTHNTRSVSGFRDVGEIENYLTQRRVRRPVCSELPENKLFATAAVSLAATVSAGALVGPSQLLGALGRIAAGRWADHVGSRMRPLRKLAVATAVVMLLLALTELPGLATCLASHGDRGSDHWRQWLAVHDDPRISGTVLERTRAERPERPRADDGCDRTPSFRALISAAGFPLAFAVCGFFPLAALPFVPVGPQPAAPGGTTGERSDRDPAGIPNERAAADAPRFM